MAHKKKHDSRVPPGNQPHGGPGGQPRKPTGEEEGEGGDVSSSQAQDPKRRQGDFVGAGEQSYKQPGGLNDANH